MGTVTLLMILARFILEVIEIIEVGIPPMDPILPFILFIIFDIVPVCENVIFSGWKVFKAMLKGLRALKGLNRSAESENYAGENIPDIENGPVEPSTENETSPFVPCNNKIQEVVPDTCDNEAPENVAETMPDNANAAPTLHHSTSHPLVEFSTHSENEISDVLHSNK